MKKNSIWVTMTYYDTSIIVSNVIQFIIKILFQICFDCLFCLVFSWWMRVVTHLYEVELNILSIDISPVAVSLISLKTAWLSLKTNDVLVCFVTASCCMCEQLHCLLHQSCHLKMIIFICSEQTSGRFVAANKKGERGFIDQIKRAKGWIDNIYVKFVFVASSKCTRLVVVHVL